MARVFVPFEAFAVSTLPVAGVRRHRPAAAASTSRPERWGLGLVFAPAPASVTNAAGIR